MFKSAWAPFHRKPNRTAPNCQFIQFSIAGSVPVFGKFGGRLWLRFPAQTEPNHRNNRSHRSQAVRHTAPHTASNSIPQSCSHHSPQATTAHARASSPKPGIRQSHPAVALAHTHPNPNTRRGSGRLPAASPQAPAAVARHGVRGGKQSAVGRRRAEGGGRAEQERLRAPHLSREAEVLAGRPSRAWWPATSRAQASERP